MIGILFQKIYGNYDKSERRGGEKRERGPEH